MTNWKNTNMIREKKKKKIFRLGICF